jgi:hypothetical protein
MEVCLSNVPSCKGDDIFDLLSAKDDHIIRKQIIIFNGVFTQTLTSLKFRSLTFDLAVDWTCIPCYIETDVPSSTTSNAVLDVARYFPVMDKSRYLSEPSKVVQRNRGYCYLDFVTVSNHYVCNNFHCPRTINMFVKLKSVVPSH